MINDFIQRLILITPPVLLALTVHEYAHAWTAFRFGDATAKNLGRVTLNPLKHLDPIGTLALFLSGLFGWAKPVPINPRNFKNPAKALIWVSLAGPLSNIVLAGVFAIALRLFSTELAPLISGYPGIYKPLFVMIQVSVIINVSLAVFNMIPIPPLDGSKVLLHALPYRKALKFSRIEPYGFIILILLIMTGVIHKFISPIVFLAVGLLTGGGY
ncbi:MAG: site-2 protease family protein [Thermodesulfobacteriota bacterium]|nr:MAG: site-2 protease family protein [Thermodesulfobacteriota bacterium]